MSLMTIWRRHHGLRASRSIFLLHFGRSDVTAHRQGRATGIFAKHHAFMTLLFFPPARARAFVENNPCYFPTASRERICIFSRHATHVTVARNEPYLCQIWLMHCDRKTGTARHQAIYSPAPSTPAINQDQ
jgi:hypothetical protein